MKEPQFPPPEKKASPESINKPEAEVIVGAGAEKTMNLFAEYCLTDEIDEDVVMDVVRELSVKLTFPDSGYSPEEKDLFVASVQAIPEESRSDVFAHALSDLAWQTSYLEGKYGPNADPLKALPNTHNYDVLFGLDTEVNKEEQDTYIVDEEFVIEGSPTRGAEETGQHHNDHEDLEYMLGDIYHELGTEDKVLLANFSRELGRDDIKNIYTFAKRYGTDGLRAMSALHGEAGYMQAVWYGNLFAYDDIDYIPKALFKKYTEIIDHSRALASTIGLDEETPLDIRLSIEEKIREKGRMILVQKLDSLLDDMGGKKYEEVIELLEETKSQGIVLVEAYRTLKGAGQIDDITDFDKVSIDSGLISEEDIENLYHTTYADNERASDLYQRRVTDSSKPGFRSYELVFDGQPLSALYTVENNEDHTVYAGGLVSNHNQDIKGTDAGMTILNTVINQYAEQNYTVEATAVLRNAIYFVNQAGFVVTKRINGAEGQPGFVIKRNDNWEFASKDQARYSLETIQNMAQTGSADEQGRIVVWTTKDVMETPAELTSQEWVATQLHEDSDNIYYLLEQFTPDDSNDPQTTGDVTGK